MSDSETKESPLEKLDRNWGDILQELRVTQTGNQILFGFLLILPFQSVLSRRGRWLYPAVLTPWLVVHSELLLLNTIDHAQPEIPT